MASECRRPFASLLSFVLLMLPLLLLLLVTTVVARVHTGNPMRGCRKGVKSYVDSATCARCTCSADGKTVGCVGCPTYTVTRHDLIKMAARGCYYPRYLELPAPHCCDHSRPVCTGSKHFNRTRLEEAIGEIGCGPLTVDGLLAEPPVQ